MSEQAFKNMAKKIGKSLGDKVDTKDIANISKKIVGSLDDNVDDIWGGIGKRLNSGKMSAGMLGDVFDEGSLDLLKKSGLDSKDLAKSLKGRVQRADDVIGIGESITKAMPEALRGKEKNFVDSLRLDGDLVDNLISDNKSGMLGDALKFGIDDKITDIILDNGLNKESISAILDKQYADYNSGKVYEAMGKKDLSSLKSNMFNSPSDMAKRNIANEVRGVDFSSMGQREIAEVGRAAQTRINSPTIKDRALYHKAPEKVAGAASMAYLVQNLSSRRGQLTNAELYNQSPQYPQGGGY